MFSKINIALSVPDVQRPERFFSFKLQQHLYNQPSEYMVQPKIFALSNIEGNFNTFCKLLLKGGVIDRYFRWIFGDGHLVIIGDCFDTGKNVSECLWLIYSLEEKARKKGGYVHFILGNREIMNLNGDWRYVHPKYSTNTSHFKKPHAALYDANNELWRWLCTKNIVEKIGRTLFVHGGISKAMLALNYSLAEINTAVRPFYTRAGESFTSAFLSTVFDAAESPFWYRGYYQGNVSEEQVNDTLQKYGVDTIVTGHTLVSQISAFFNGRVINIDTDHSGDTSEGLLIQRGNYYSLSRNGTKKKIK